MKDEEIKDLFEKEVLDGTCFESLNELLKDKTAVQINAPRALIACNLKGVLNGMNIINKKHEAERKEWEKEKIDLENDILEAKSIPFNKKVKDLVDEFKKEKKDLIKKIEEKSFRVSEAGQKAIWLEDIIHLIQKEASDGN